jgi:hypothetical protein
VDPAEALEVLRRAIQAAPPPAPALKWSRLWDLYSADPPVSPSTFATYGHGVIELSRKGTKARRSRYTQVSSRCAELLQNLPRPGDHVFLNPRTRRPYTPNWFLTKWRRACEKAGVSGPDGNVTIHDGRRTFATEMRRAGVQESEIMDMAGWKTREVFTRYNVVSFDDIIAAKKKYEAHLRRSARRPARQSVESGLTCSGKSISMDVARTER